MSISQSRMTGPKMGQKNIGNVSEKMAAGSGGDEEVVDRCKCESIHTHADSELRLGKLCYTAGHNSRIRL